jgi:hypothetical protein
MAMDPVSVKRIIGDLVERAFLLAGHCWRALPPLIIPKNFSVELTNYPRSSRASSSIC